MAELFKCNNIQNLIAELNRVDSHGMASIIAVSEIKLTKKSRADKSPTPDFLEGLVRIAKSVVNLNHDYNKAVRNQIEKAGCDPSDWQPEPSKFSEPDPSCPNGIVRQHKDDSSKKYIRVFVGMNSSKAYEEVYINGKGENVTDLITQDIKDNFFPKKSGSQKQAMSGSGKEIKPREYKAENILYVKKGDVIFNGGLTQEVLDLFNLELV